MLELDLRDGGGHRRQRPAAGPGQHPPRLGQLLGRRQLVLERGSGLEPRERDDELVLRLPGIELPGRRRLHGRGARDRQRAERPVAGHEPDVHVRHHASDHRAIRDRSDDGHEPGRVREAGKRLPRLCRCERRERCRLRDCERLDRDHGADGRAAARLRVGLHRRRPHVRVQERAAHRLHAAGAGQQELHGRRRGRGRQHERTGELRRAGRQHGPVAGDGDRGDDGDEPAGLREAGRDVPGVCERERSAVGRGHLLGRQPRDAAGERVAR